MKRILYGLFVLTLLLSSSVIVLVKACYCKETEISVSYRVDLPDEIKIGTRKQLKVTVYNTGDRTIENLWLCLDIFRGNKPLEETYTGIPGDTGSLGVIRFRQQGQKLSVKRSRTFSTYYKFDTTRTKHQYSRGKYKFLYQAWDGLPGKGGKRIGKQHEKDFIIIGRETEEAREELKKAEEELWKTYEEAEKAYHDLKSTKGTEVFQSIEKALSESEIDASKELSRIATQIGKKYGKKVQKQAAKGVGLIGTALTYIKIGKWVGIDITLISKNIKYRKCYSKLKSARKRYDKAVEKLQALEKED